MTSPGIRALGTIPPGWKARFSDKSEWDKCNGEQIKAACVGKALRFDKACIAIRTLEIAFSDSEMRREAAGEFMGLQQFIDMVERAMQHEATLDRPPPKLPAMPESRRRES